MKLSKPGFRYDTLPAQTATDVLACAAEIRDHAAGAAQSAIEIGLCLLKVKAALPHGLFGDWLAAEFPNLSDRHARRLMAVADRMGRLKSDTVSEMAIGTLALLAESDLSDEQFAEALEAGPLTRSQARRLVHQAATAPEPDDGVSVCPDCGDARLDDGDCPQCARQAAASRIRPRTDVPPIPDLAEGEIQVITDDLPPRAPLPVAPAAPRRAVEPAARPVAKSEPEEIPCPHCGGSGRIKAGKEALCSRG